MLVLVYAPNANCPSAMHVQNKNSRGFPETLLALIKQHKDHTLALKVHAKTYVPARMHRETWMALWPHYLVVCLLMA